MTTKANAGWEHDFSNRVRWVLLALTAFGAVSALGGAAELVSFPLGNEYVPLKTLEGTAFSTYLVPGLLLGGLVAGTQLVAAFALWRKEWWQIEATVVAGGAMTIWILAELAQLRERHWLQGLYLALGAMVLFLGVRAMLQRGSSFDRWVLWVTLGESLGFAIPALSAGLALWWGLGDVMTALVLVAAGFFEGFCLGWGQALAWPLPVAKLRYAGLSGLGALASWTLGMSMSVFGPRLWSASPALAALVLGLGAGALLLGLGVFQVVELRRHSITARSWIGTTALAWLVALPISFLPGPLVDETTPGATIVSLWILAGFLMAYVMSVLTYQGVRRVLRGAPSVTGLDMACEILERDGRHELKGVALQG